MSVGQFTLLRLSNILALKSLLSIEHGDKELELFFDSEDDVVTDRDDVSNELRLEVFSIGDKATSNLVLLSVLGVCGGFKFDQFSIRLI